MTLQAFLKERENGAWVIDTRLPNDFIAAYIPGALYLGRAGKIAEWAKVFVPQGQAVLIVSAAGEEEQSQAWLHEAGVQNVLGALDGGFATWSTAGLPLDMIIDIEADELLMDLPHDKKLEIIDVRSADKYGMAHVKGATHKPLALFADLAEVADINDDHNLYVHCGGGNSAIIACSILKREGYEKLRLINGGFKAISEVKGMPIVEMGVA